MMSASGRLFYADLRGNGESQSGPRLLTRFALTPLARRAGSSTMPTAIFVPPISTAPITVIPFPFYFVSSANREGAQRTRILRRRMSQDMPVLSGQRRIHVVGADLATAPSE